MRLEQIGSGIDLNSTRSAGLKKTEQQAADSDGNVFFSGPWPQEASCAAVVCFNTLRCIVPARYCEMQ